MVAVRPLGYCNQQSLVDLEFESLCCSREQSFPCLYQVLLVPAQHEAFHMTGAEVRHA